MGEPPACQGGKQGIFQLSYHPWEMAGKLLRPPRAGKTHG